MRPACPSLLRPAMLHLEAVERASGIRGEANVEGGHPQRVPTLKGCERRRSKARLRAAVGLPGTDLAPRNEDGKAALTFLASVIGLFTAVIGLLQVLYSLGAIKGPASPLESVIRVVRDPTDMSEIFEEGPPDSGEATLDAPSELSANGACQVTLTWRTPADTSNVVSYEIYDNDKWSGSVSGASNNQTTREVAPGTHTWAVTASDGIGQESEPSNADTSEECDRNPLDDQ